MNDQERMDDARSKALERIEESERMFKSLAVLVIFLEVALGITLIVLTDFSNRIQLLIFVATAVIYAPLICGLASLWAHANRNAQRILQAIALLADGGRTTPEAANGKSSGK